MSEMSFYWETGDISMHVTDGLSVVKLKELQVGRVARKHHGVIPLLP